MRLASWISGFKSRLLQWGPAPRNRQRARSKTIATRLDYLEDRTLLTAIVWDGDAGDFDFNNDLNWVGDVAPGVNDDATIDVAGDIAIHFSSSETHLSSLSCNETLTVEGTLEIAHSSTIKELVLYGLLTGDGNVSISDQFTWSAGSMSGTGTTTVLPAATMTIYGGNYHFLDGKTLLNEGAGTWINNWIVLNNNAHFNNAGTLDVQTDYGIQSAVGGGTFNNTGAITRTQGVGNTIIYDGVVFLNSGMLSVESGTWSAYGAATSTGSFSVATDANLDLHNQTLTGTSSITGAGHVNLVDSTIAGTYNVTGSTSLDGVTDFTGTVTSVGNLTAAGNADFHNVTLTVPHLSVFGSLTSGDITISETLDWYAGTMAGTGTNTVLPAATMTIYGGNYHFLDGKTLLNEGAGTWINNWIFLNNNAHFNNAGTLDVQTDYGIQSAVGGGTFNNTGAITRTQGVGNTIIYDGVVFLNSGMLSVESGTWSAYGAATSTGSFSVATDANLDLHNQTLTGTSSITGAGHVNLVDSTVAGTYNVTGSTSLDGMTKFTGTVSSVGELTVGGVAEFSPIGGPATLTIPGLTIYGTLKGTDNFRVDGPFNWAGGALQGVNGHGSLTVLSDMTLNGNYTVDQFNLINKARTDWTGGTVRFLNASRFTNSAGALFDDQIDGTFGSYDGTISIFDNAGLFLKSGSTGTTYLDMQLNNSGTVQVDQGSLNLGRGYVPLPGGGGSGSIGIYIPGEFVPEPGPMPLTFASYTQTVSGALVERIKGLAPGTEYGQITVNNGVSLAGTLEVELFNNFAPSVGNTFLVINKTSAGPIEGTFNDLPEGGHLVSGIYEFEISYQGGTDNNDVTLTVSRILNNPPVITSFDTDVLYTENAAAVILDTNVAVTDADSPDFGNGSLTVTLTSHQELADRLSIRDQGTTAGRIGISGNQVKYSGVQFATFSGGTDGNTPLVISFLPNASKIAVQTLLRNLMFSNISDNPSTQQRTVELRLTDGDSQSSTPVTKSINISAVNDKPILGSFGPSGSYTEDASPTVLAMNGTVTDVDSSNFDLGKLMIRVSANAQYTDRLSIRNQGSDAGQIGVSGSNVTYSNVVIGTFTGTTVLTVTLNDQATPEAVQALLQNVAFSSISGAPSTATRTISASLTDGDGGTSATVFTTVDVIAVNDAPVIGAFDLDVIYRENGVPIQLDSNATVLDVDLLDFDGGVLTVDLTANGHVDDRLSIRDQGVGPSKVSVIGNEIRYGYGDDNRLIGTFSGGTSGLIPLVITFNVDAKQIAVQAVLRNVVFNNVSDAPYTLVRTVRVQLTDGDGATSNESTKLVNITAVNDAPVVTGFSGSASYTEDDGPTLLAINTAVTDVDSANFEAGRLSIRIASNVQSTDRLTIRNQGTAAGEIGISGTNVTYGSIVIGAFAGTNSLTVTLNDQATPEAVQALLRNIGFSSISGAPSTAPRTITASLTDGDGGTSLLASVSVNVTAVNDAPVLGGTGSAVNYREGAVPTLVISGATLVDPDFNGGLLTISLPVGSAANDLLEIRNVGTGAGQIGVSGNTISYGGIAIGTFSGGGAGGELVISLLSNTTALAAQAVLRNITFRVTGNFTANTSRTIRFSLQDADGALSNVLEKQINIINLP
jgi:hypothetical protein